MWGRRKKQALGPETLREELEGLRGDEMRLLDKFVLSGTRTMDLPLSDYAADSLQKRSLIQPVGRRTRSDQQTLAIPQDVWNAWKRMLARRA